MPRPRKAGSPVPKDDGRLAFPFNTEAEYHFGMSLREWYAGQALGGILADPASTAEPEIIAAVCFRYADAMIEEGKK